MNFDLLHPFSLFGKRKACVPKSTKNSDPAGRTCGTEKSDYFLSGIGKSEFRPDLLSTVHNNARPLGQSREADKIGKARWNTNNTEQPYKPGKTKFDPRIELYYQQLGLGDEADEAEAQDDWFWNES